MIILAAPYPLIETQTVLPNPQFSDVQQRNLTMDRKRTMNGTLYTYVNDKGTTRLTYTFELTRMKSIELQRFVRAYFSQKIKLTNHKNESWLVNFDGNPFEVAEAKKSGPGADDREADTVSITFEGTQL